MACPISSGWDSGYGDSGTQGAEFGGEPEKAPGECTGNPKPLQRLRLASGGVLGDVCPGGGDGDAAWASAIDGGLLFKRDDRATGVAGAGLAATAIDLVAATWEGEGGDDVAAGTIGEASRGV